MPPQDKTPVGDAMTHRFPEQQIPQPRPDAVPGSGEGGTARDASDADITQKPTAPEHQHTPSKQRG